MIRFLKVSSSDIVRFGIIRTDDVLFPFLISTTVLGSNYSINIPQCGLRMNVEE